MAIIEPGATAPTNTFAPPQDSTKPSVVPQPVGPFDPANAKPLANQTPVPAPVVPAAVPVTPKKSETTTTPTADTGTGAPKKTDAYLKKEAENAAKLAEQDRLAKEAANKPADTVPDSTDVTTSVNPDGSTTTTTETYTDTVTKEMDDYLRKYNDTLDAETKYATDKFNAIAIGADAAQAAMILAINAAYDVRTNQMKRINEAQLKTTTAIGLRNNRMRYTPDLQNSILTNQERSGIQELSKLDAERLRLLAEAQKAATDEDLNILGQRMDKLKAVRSEQMDVMTKLYGLAVENEERTRLREELNTQTEVQVQKNLIAQIGNLLSLDTTLTPAQTEEYATRLGVTNENITQYVEAQQAIAAQKTVDEEIASMQKLMTLLNDSPEGMKYVFNINGEDVEYTGQKVGKTTTYKEFNKSTNTVSFITLDASGKILTTEKISGIGTPYAATGGNSLRKGMQNSDGSLMTFEQYVEKQEDDNQVGFDRTNAAYMSSLRVEYNNKIAQAGLSEKDKYAAIGLTPLTDAAKRTGVLNYVKKNPGKDPNDFNYLSAIEQIAYSKLTQTNVEDDTGEGYVGESTATGGITSGSDDADSAWNTDFGSDAEEKEG